MFRRSWLDCGGGIGRVHRQIAADIRFCIKVVRIGFELALEAPFGRTRDDRRRRRVLWVFC